MIFYIKLLCIILYQKVIGNYNRIDNAKVVTAEYVKKAVVQRIERVNKYDQNLVEMIQNQKGEIQPIGGVTDKIEGFFEICKLRGLTGE